MITINAKFIFPQILNIIFQVSVLSFFSFSIISNREEEGPIVDLLLADSFFYYVELLCKISMVYNYLTHYNTTFRNILQLNNFKHSFFIFNFQKIASLLINFSNLLICLCTFVPMIYGGYKTFYVNICIYYILFTTAVKILIFVLLSIILIFSHQQRNAILNEMYLNPNIIPVEKKEGDVCCICLDENSNKEWGEILCAHRYHVEWISTWMSNHTTCPICRLIII